MTWKNLAFLLFLVVAFCPSQQEEVIYVDPERGTTDMRCWTGGRRLPCKTIEIALNGAKQIKDSAIMTLNPTKPSGKNEVEIVEKNHEGDAAIIDCPTWMNYNSTSNSCECGDSLDDIVICNATWKVVLVLDCYQMTYDINLKQEIVGKSFYGCMIENEAESAYNVYHKVPINKYSINDGMCSEFNREGRLCGKCKENYTNFAYSYNLSCSLCTDVENRKNWYKALAVGFIPITLTYLLAVLLNFNANSPSLHSFVFVAQMMSTQVNVRILMRKENRIVIPASILNLLISLYSLWSLDFFRSMYPDICLKLTTLQTLSLEYTIAVYPPVLMLLTCIFAKLHSSGYRVVIWAWKPFQLCLLRVKKKWDLKTSMVDMFSTFLLLSYHKLLGVNFDLLAYVSPKNSTGNTVGRYLYYDASYEYFGKQHLPYGIIALIMFTTFNVLPLILLLLYPMKWFQKCLNCRGKNQAVLHTFVDSFAGCFKDGTEPGTRDCRYFAALFLLVRITLYIVYQVTLTDYFYGACALTLAAFVIALSITQPYKRKYNKYNAITIALFVLLIMITISFVNVDLATSKGHHLLKLSIIVAAIVAIFPQLYIIGLTIIWITKQRMFTSLVSRCCCKAIKRSESETSLLTAADLRIGSKYM